MQMNQGADIANLNRQFHNDSNFYNIQLTFDCIFSRKRKLRVHFVLVAKYINKWPEYCLWIQLEFIRIIALFLKADTIPVLFTCFFSFLTKFRVNNQCL